MKAQRLYRFLQEHTGCLFLFAHRSPYEPGYFNLGGKVGLLVSPITTGMSKYRVFCRFLIDEKIVDDWFENDDFSLIKIDESSS